jgi:hypothetical protein
MYTHYHGAQYHMQNYRVRPTYLGMCYLELVTHFPGPLGDQVLA